MVFPVICTRFIWYETIQNLGDFVFDQEYRISLGQKVKDIASHYFAGLEEISPNEAKQQFVRQLARGDLLAASALRMAEKEVLSPEFK